MDFILEKIQKFHVMEERITKMENTNNNLYEYLHAFHSETMFIFILSKLSYLKQHDIEAYRKLERYYL
jgi:hypothetical protein